MKRLSRAKNILLKNNSRFIDFIDLLSSSRKKSSRKCLLIFLFGAISILAQSFQNSDRVCYGKWKCHPHAADVTYIPGPTTECVALAIQPWRPQGHRSGGSSGSTTTKHHNNQTPSRTTRKELCRSQIDMLFCKSLQYSLWDTKKNISMEWVKFLDLKY